MPRRYFNDPWNGEDYLYHVRHADLPNGKLRYIIRKVGKPGYNPDDRNKYIIVPDKYYNLAYHFSMYPGYDQQRALKELYEILLMECKERIEK